MKKVEIPVDEADDTALPCEECGSCFFHLISSGVVECAECNTVYEGVEWFPNNLQ